MLPLSANVVEAGEAGWTWMGSGTPTEWVVFTVVVGLMLVIDLFVLNRHEHVVSTREALLQTAAWIFIALCFGGYIAWDAGTPPAILYVTGFVVEKALSVDNLFVFLVVFSYFRVRPIYQRRVLSWGILTAVVLRAAFIFGGAALINRFEWLLYVFGAFLLYTAWKLLTKGDEEVEPEHNPALRLLRRFVPMSPNYDGSHFFTKIDGRTMATPLLAVLVVIETTDVVFALDSVPAIFGITTDPFLVYTSNIFAILGLRALFFALAAIMGKFRYLNVGLSLVLAFVGVKLIGHHQIDHFGTEWIGPKWSKIEPVISLSIVMLLLTGSVIASILNPEKAPHAPPVNPGETGGFAAAAPPPEAKAAIGAKDEPAKS